MTEMKIDNKFGDILVIVPHQDDEILMTAGILHAAAGCGLKVKVLMVTNGDYGCRDYSKGRKRLMECQAGLRILGLQEEQLISLGYADTGMEEDVSFISRLFKEINGEKIVSSSCSKETYGLLENPEYHFRIYGEHAPYTRNNLRNDLKEVILQEQPDHIFTTSRYDLHGDHAALYWFIREVLEELEESGYSPQLYTGLVHSMAGDESWPLREGTTYTCPQGFSCQQELKWEERISFLLPENMCGRDLKKEALKQHEEALEPNAVEYLMSFLKEEEIFWKVTSA